MGAGPSDAQRPLLAEEVPSAPPMPGAPPGYGGAVVPMPTGYPNPYANNQPGSAYPPVPGMPAFAPASGPGDSAPSGLPSGPPGAPMVVEQHTHLHVPPQAPLVSRASDMPRSHLCPSCGASGPTRVKRESGCCTWLTSFAMCWVCLPLFWLPFCLDCDKDLVHRCGRCGTEIARIKPFV